MIATAPRILTRQHLKQIRAEQHIEPYQMAERLGVQLARYLAIETGSIPIPRTWVDGRYWLFRKFDSVPARPRRAKR